VPRPKIAMPSPRMNTVDVVVIDGGIASFAVASSPDSYAWRVGSTDRAGTRTRESRLREKRGYSDDADAQCGRRDRGRVGERARSGTTMRGNWWQAPPDEDAYHLGDRRPARQSKRRAIGRSALAWR
jgi:hypothetical protein